PSQTRPNPQHPGFVLSSLPTITGREDALHDAIMSTNRVPHQLGKSEALRDAPVSLIFSVEPVHRTRAATALRRRCSSATGSVSSEAPAATSSAVENDSPAARVPTRTDPIPVPESKPIFQTALAALSSSRRTADNESSSVRFCRPP